MRTDFEKFAISCGINSNTLDTYKKKNTFSVNPMILEEREMNVIGLDVFSRLQVDRILFLGEAIDSDVANTGNAVITAATLTNNGIVRIGKDIDYSKVKTC